MRMTGPARRGSVTAMSSMSAKALFFQIYE
jgi:hypothetical protein